MYSYDRYSNRTGKVETADGDMQHMLYAYDGSGNLVLRSHETITSELDAGEELSLVDVAAAVDEFDWNGFGELTEARVGGRESDIQLPTGRAAVSQERRRKRDAARVGWGADGDGFRRRLSDELATIGVNYIVNSNGNLVLRYDDWTEGYMTENELRDELGLDRRVNYK